jgi:hypothetical protein
MTLVTGNKVLVQIYIKVFGIFSDLSTFTLILFPVNSRQVQLS